MPRPLSLLLVALLAPPVAAQDKRRIVFKLN